MRVTRGWLAAVVLAACTGRGDADDAEPPGGRDDSDPAVADPVPGVPTLQRHPVSWLVHATTDLLGVAPDVSALPLDPATDGYDTVASGLTLSPELLAGWADAVDDLTTDLTAGRPVSLFFTPRGSADVTGARVRDGRWVFPRAGRIELSFYAPTAGRYTLRLLRDIGQRVGLPADPPAIQTWAGGVDQRDADIVDYQTDYTELQLVVGDTFEPGWHALWLDLPDEPGAPDVQVLELEVAGPDAPVPSAARDALFPCEPGAADDADAWLACAATILDPLVRRAWRTADPLDDAWLAATVDDVRAHDEPFAEVIRLGLDRVLLSPRFLLRHEGGGAEGDALAPAEVAGRLARFLWASVPDDALLAAAADGTLSDPAGLTAQVDRMLADPRAARMLDDFAGQWLGYDRLDRVRLDPARYPELDDALRAAMRAELRALVDRLWIDDLPVTTLVTATTAHVEPPLDAVYGVPAGDDADVAALGRRGVLGAAGVHALTSMPGRTSPTVRGAWVLDRLLCDPPGSPPANVPSLPEGDDVREAAAAHADNPACSGCHSKMDPLGLALEAFDPIGRFRAAYPDGAAVDATGELPDGTVVHGAADLADLLADDPRLPRCAARELLTYALGRVLSKDDDVTVDRVAEAYGGASLRELVEAIATDPVFGRLEGAR